MHDSLKDLLAFDVNIRTIAVLYDSSFIQTKVCVIIKITCIDSWAFKLFNPWYHFCIVQIIESILSEQGASTKAYVSTESSDSNDDPLHNLRRPSAELYNDAAKSRQNEHSEVQYESDIAGKDVTSEISIVHESHQDRPAPQSVTPTAPSALSPAEMLATVGYVSVDDSSDFSSSIESLTFPSNMVPRDAVELLFSVTATLLESPDQPQYDEQLLVMQQEPVTE